MIDLKRIFKTTYVHRTGRSGTRRWFYFDHDFTYYVLCFGPLMFVGQWK